MSVNIKDIVPVINAVHHMVSPEEIIDNVSIDSRSLQNNSQTLYFALKGQNRDGSEFIPALIAKGVRHFVVHQIPDGLQQQANFLVVEDTLSAFQNFVSFYRKGYHFPVIGITGSNGKTIVKEWLNFLMHQEYSIIRSPKSYNSQVGVPISVIAINENHNLGIFEAGISTTGEMQRLQPIIAPTVGILTHIGSAHEEGFASVTEKIQEKLKLFTQVEVLIMQYDNAVLPYVPQHIKTFSWSFDQPEATVQLRQENKILHLTYQGNTFDVTLPFQDRASVENAMSCILTLLHFNYSIQTIQERLQKLYTMETRLEVKRGINNSTLIDDSYNSDYQSLKIALDFLEQHKSDTKKTVILSDVFQSGFDADILYQKVAQLLQQNYIDQVVGIGPKISTHLKYLSNFTGFESTAAFVAQFNEKTFANQTILIKGARSFKFDEIVVLLEEKTHETVLEINLNALAYNLNFYKSKVQPQTKIMVMVKAFGYGSGSFEIAKELQHHKVNYLGVAFADEGVELRQAGIHLPIIVMNPEVSGYPAMLAYQLELEVYSIKSLQSFLNFAQKRNVSNYPIHIKLDTGMHRLGFEEKDLPELIEILQNNTLVKVASIYSHLSSSDVPSYDDFTLQQFDKFERWSQTLMEALPYKPIRHILNTSGIYRFPQYQYDMVRLGIGVYGVGNDPQEDRQLENVGTLKTIILQIREVEPGESIGYSRKFKTDRSMKIATIPIGYADGIPRAWGNERGHVMIDNQPARILGNICMDALMVDVTDLQCKEGDTVIIFGKSLRVTTIADTIGTISYEILTGISQRVKRIFYKE